MCAVAACCPVAVLRPLTSSTGRTAPNGVELLEMTYPRGTRPVGLVRGLVVHGKDDPKVDVEASLCLAAVRRRMASFSATLMPP